MSSENVTISKGKLQELEQRIDAMREVAREALQKCDKLLKIAQGETQ